LEKRRGKGGQGFFVEGVHLFTHPTTLRTEHQGEKEENPLKRQGGKKEKGEGTLKIWGRYSTASCPIHSASGKKERKTGKDKREGKEKKRGVHGAVNRTSLSR